MVKKEAQVVTRDAEKLNQILIENFVNLQKAVTNLSIRFESLSDQITKLLSLFEISAKSFSENMGKYGEIEKDSEFLNKLDKLLEQNKLIAKGITIMEEKVREKITQSSSTEIERSPRPAGFNPASYMPSISKELEE